MIYPDLPIKALSIMQPWSFLIAVGAKDIENRDRRTSHRGPVAIHAGMKFDQHARSCVENGIHPVTGDVSMFGLKSTDADALTAMLDGHLNGGIVGVADIVDCVDQSDSEWFVGRYGFVLANAWPVPFIPVTGALGFFDWRKMLGKDEAKRLAK